jgi:putative endonuclease
MKKIGDIGEKLVAIWLESQDWAILHHHWHCRWGEIDIIAQKHSSRQIIFVEVKTLSKNYLDDDGLLAITNKKQLKISRTATMFLTENQILSEYFCRFDVALVSCQKQLSDAKSIERQSSILIESGYQFTLQKYIKSAFDLSNDI